MRGQTGACSQACQQRKELEKLQPSLRSHLLSPEELLRKESHQNAGRSSALSCNGYMFFQSMKGCSSTLKHGRQGILVCQRQEVKIQPFILDW